jgi:hypothetical protein
MHFLSNRNPDIILPSPSKIPVTTTGNASKCLMPTFAEKIGRKIIVDWNAKLKSKIATQNPLKRIFLSSEHLNMFVLFGSTSSLEIFPPSVIDLFLEMTVSFICIF